MPAANTTERIPTLRTLRKGMSGPDVTRLQNFLRGKGYFFVVADGKFGNATQMAVINYQDSKAIPDDGIAGRKTLAVMIGEGLDVVTETDEAIDWPPPLDGLNPITTNEQRQRLYGRFSYVSAPETGNPEAIRITDDWEETNIVRVELPIISGKFLKGRPVAVHRYVASDIQAWLTEVEDAGKADLILTFDGLWAPRFIRGSCRTLSAHAWATAIDINADWNGLGVYPPGPKQRGSVRELVALANRHNFYWGGHFKRRKDGMHFEHVRSRA